MKHVWALIWLIIAGFLLSQANNLIAFVSTITVFILAIVAIYWVRD
jgi:hypothetical protein